MDRLEHYRSLALSGLDEYLQEAAPAALIRNKPTGDISVTGNDDAEETLVGLEVVEHSDAEERMAVHPLEKKKGAPFSDMITVGRTPNNDVVLNDITVSRFHAYFKQKGKQWVVCDAGSKNGTRVDGVKLEKRKEHPVQDGTHVRIGDIDTTFQLRDSLYELLLKA